MRVGDISDLAPLAKSCVHSNDVDPHRAAEELFKLAVECDAMPSFRRIRAKLGSCGEVAVAASADAAGMPNGHSARALPLHISESKRNVGRRAALFGAARATIKFDQNSSSRQVSSGLALSSLSI